MTTDNSELSEIRAGIDAMLDVACAGRRRIRAHLMWEVRQMFSRVAPDDMTDAELAALLAVFETALARMLTPPSGDGPVLRLVAAQPSNLDR